MRKEKALRNNDNDRLENNGLCPRRWRPPLLPVLPLLCEDIGGNADVYLDAMYVFLVCIDALFLPWSLPVCSLPARCLCCG